MPIVLSIVLSLSFIKKKENIFVASSLSVRKSSYFLFSYDNYGASSIFVFFIIITTNELIYTFLTYRKDTTSLDNYFILSLFEGNVQG